MFCTNCGQKLKAKARFCEYCGYGVEEDENPNIINNPVQNNNINNSGANTLCTISLVCFVFPILLYILTIPFTYNTNGKDALPILINLTGTMSSIAALVLMIVARVKYPKSTFANVLMWVYISLYAIGLIVFIIVLIFVFFIYAGYHY